jgi:hypothetical protein
MGSAKVLHVWNALLAGPVEPKGDFVLRNALKKFNGRVGEL